MRRLAFWMVVPAWLGAAFVLAAGFLGALHPAGDSLAVFRLQAALAVVVLSVVLAALSGRARRWLAAAGVAVVAAAPAALSWVHLPSAAPVPVITVYQKNLLFRLADREAIAADIRATGADVVTLQEVSGPNLALLEELREDYPHQAFCPFLGVGGTAVLSRFPAVAAPVCPQARGATALKVGGPAGAFWVVSVHLHWPWPYGQSWHVEALMPDLAALDGPVMLAGDFNMVPWGASVRAMARAARVERVGPTATTLALLGGAVPLPIDHVLLPEAWTGTHEIRPALGSDHRGVVVRATPAH